MSTAPERQDLKRRVYEISRRKFRFGRSVRTPGDTLKTFSIQTYNGLSWFRWRPLLRWKTKPRRALKPAPGPLLDLQSIPWDCPTSVTLYSEKQFRLS
jgi:hypothetical protein